MFASSSAYDQHCSLRVIVKVQSCCSLFLPKKLHSIGQLFLFPKKCTPLALFESPINYIQRRPRHSVEGFFTQHIRAPGQASRLRERGGAGRKPKFSLKEKMRTKPSAWREETRGSGSIFLCMREKFEKSDRAPEKAVPFWERGEGSL